MDGAFNREFDGFAGGRGRGRGAGFRGTAENAKTKLCTRWMQGDCRFGDRCNFAHGEHELRQEPAGGPGRGFGSPGRGSFNGAGRGFGPGRGGYGAGRGYGPGRGYPGYGQGAYGGMEQDAGGYQQGAGEPGDNDDVWAAQGYPVPGPNGWTMYRTKEGEPYYHNQKTNLTVWDRPADWPVTGP